MIKKMGYNVVNIVSTCKETLNTLKETSVDLILMDININGRTNGISTAMLIKEKFNIPIIYITAISNLKKHNRVKQTEPYGYIKKPIDYDQLQKTIKKELNKHKKNTDLK